MISIFSALVNGPEEPVKLTGLGQIKQCDQGCASRDDDDAPMIDAATFNEMMNVIGSRGRDEFLAYLASDLRSVAVGLDAAIETRDAREAQKKAHILIGLAGTVGATRLHAMATALHRDAAKGTGQSFRLRCAQTLGELDRLIQFCLGTTAAERLA